MLRRLIITTATIIALSISFKPMEASAHWHGGWGWGVGAGFLAGALIGGALARPYYYAPSPYYYAPGYYYEGPEVDDAVGYCMRRFRSYDPRSGTYLGYDGYRHPCP
jgi:hypothetical protein